MSQFKFLVFAFSVILFSSCNKNDNEPSDYTYYQVGFDTPNADWRDTAFIVRTNNSQLIQLADAQLAMPVSERQIVFGALAAGDAGYNKNATHTFKWHFKEDDWKFVDLTAEIYDGKPFTDIDSDTTYWIGNIKRFGAWSSHLSKKLPGKP